MENISFLPLIKGLKGRFNNIKNREVYVVDIQKEEVWESYIKGYPLEIRPQFLCNSCRHFLNIAGGMVIINDEGELESIWDFKVQQPFQEVVNNLKELTLTRKIKNIFRYSSRILGNPSNLDSSSSFRWHHLTLELPYSLIDKNANSTQAIRRDNKVLLERALNEITLSSVTQTLHLIYTNQIYRGEEHKGLLESFKRLQELYTSIPPNLKDNFYWFHSHNFSVCRIRNTAIGSLLLDLSENTPLNIAINRFQQVMDPENYKRPTPTYSSSMVDNCRKTLETMGLLDSLDRRQAIEEDISINDLLFIDRSYVSPPTSIFTELTQSLPVKPPDLNNVPKVSLIEFISDILPKAQQLEVLFETNLSSRLMTLIAPINQEAPSITKWKGNNFTWSYNGGLTDASLKAKVKAAGGNVEGVLRCSLEWYNQDDLDIHLNLPTNEHIHFANRKGKNGGELDIDMNVSPPLSRKPVENIIFPSKSSLIPGDYHLVVHNFNCRETKDIGFKVEIEYQDTLWEFNHRTGLKHKENISVAKFSFDGTNVKILSSIPFTLPSQQIWNLKPNLFYRVNMVMLSPNYWLSGNQQGNQHLFLMLPEAKAEGPLHAFYNEFIDPSLFTNHKKVMEALSSTITVQTNAFNRQVSGLGFSSTSEASFLVRLQESNTPKLLRVMTGTIGS